MSVQTRSRERARDGGWSRCRGEVPAQAANLLRARSARRRGLANSPELLELLLSGTEDKGIRAVAADKAHVRKHSPCQCGLPLPCTGIGQICSPAAHRGGLRAPRLRPSLIARVMRAWVRTSTPSSHRIRLARIHQARRGASQDVWPRFGEDHSGQLRCESVTARQSGPAELNKFHLASVIAAGPVGNSTSDRPTRAIPPVPLAEARWVDHGFSIHERRTKQIQAEPYHKLSLGECQSVCFVTRVVAC